MSYLVRKSLTASNTSHQSSMLLVCLWANGDHANQDVFTWNWKPHEQLACLFSEAVFISCQVNHINEIFNLLLMSEPFVHLFDELNWWGGKNHSWSLLAGITTEQKNILTVFYAVFIPYLTSDQLPEYRVIWSEHQRPRTQENSVKAQERNLPHVLQPPPRNDLPNLRPGTYGQGLWPDGPHRDHH